ncbi:2-keto-4-pentenoate hydratase/2-oxohepta-3-ene-1,7-dioic acid hydratase in catechol pathway [Bradyrhizobium elkanii]|jgi:2-keto-4-pentenoate hydratase/2-oxohepta-3-ene-1,7-dioic acid hydratase in catechol pathway
MRLVTFSVQSRRSVGALLANDRIVDLTASTAADSRASGWFRSMQDMIEGGAEALSLARQIISHPSAAAIVPMVEAKLLAPLPRPVRMRDCNMFTEHVERFFERKDQLEAEAAAGSDQAAAQLAVAKRLRFDLLLERLTYYTVDPLSVSGPDEDIQWPTYSMAADFELEWAVVIGTRGKDIPLNAARDHVFGYTIFNDWSARDEQLIHMEMGIGPGGGKDFDGAVTLGPCIATSDEFRDMSDVRMIARVNGEEWTNRSSRHMRFTFEQAIVEMSRSRTIFPGDIFASGTVLGGSGVDHGRSLKDGDAVELEVEGIGVLRNRVRIATRGSG